MFILDGRNAFYQWDLEQKITSEKFKAGDQIHFTNGEQSTAIVLIAYELNGLVVVDVPNILLQSDIPITVYRYIKTTENSHTIEQKDFYIIPRTKPSDYIYTPTEYHTVEKAVEEALTKAKESGDFKGDKGEKGDKGDAGSIKFIPVAELPTENIDLSAVYLVPAADAKDNNRFLEYANIDGKWEFIGSMSADINLDELVKNTDYATTKEAGIVKTAGWSGVYMQTSEILGLKEPTQKEIEDRNQFKAILCKNLDYAVKVGLTANTETLTEEEKAAACEWLGVNALVGDIETALDNIIAIQERTIALQESLIGGDGR